MKPIHTNARKYRWELILLGLIGVSVVWATGLSPYYLESTQLLNSSRTFVFTGIMALGLMTVIMTGEMDLSLPSILAVCTVLLSKASSAALPLPVAVIGILLVASCLGALNGFLVAKLRLPALAVTLGTMGAYRGLAFIIGSEVGYTGFNDTYKFLGAALIGSTEIPLMLPVFFAVVAFFVVLLHFTTFGRRLYAIGNNASAVAYSGISVVGTKVVAYVLAAVMAALGAWIFIGQYGSARGDNANGVILAVLTSVVLGGVDINGGKGTVFGVLASIIFLWTLRNGMGLANIAGPIQQLIIGALLIVAVLVSNFAGSVGRTAKTNVRETRGRRPR
jgi:rhamnose transport system permease protein